MNRKLVKFIPQEQMIVVKHIDLLSYLQKFEPNSLIKKGKHYESVVHKGLTITDKKWQWKEKKLSGRTAIEYLVFVEQMSFIDAAYLLFQCLKQQGVTWNGNKRHQ